MHRKSNEDAYLADQSAGVWVVADGMGGHAHGATASRYVVDAFRRMPAGRSFEDRVGAAHRRIHAANDRVYGASRALERCAIMGSTVAALVVQEQRFAALWAGDSRVYHCRAGQLRRITRDHSVAQQLVDAGKLRPSEAHRHPTASRITRAVGARPTVTVDESRGELLPGDRMLLCSDGLTSEVEDIEIATLLTEFGAQAAAAELMALALERGARDNVTVLVVDAAPVAPALLGDPSTTLVFDRVSRSAAGAGPGF